MSQIFSTSVSIMKSPKTPRKEVPGEAVRGMVKEAITSARRRMRSMVSAARRGMPSLVTLSALATCLDSTPRR